MSSSATKPEVTHIDNAFAFARARSQDHEVIGEVALILLNRPVGLPFLRAVWRSTTYRMAADGGAKLLLHAIPGDERLQFLPDAICGDFDSIDDATWCECGLKMQITYVPASTFTASTDRYFKIAQPPYRDHDELAVHFSLKRAFHWLQMVIKTLLILRSASHYCAGHMPR